MLPTCHANSESEFLTDLQLPMQNKADKITTKSKSIKYSSLMGNPVHTCQGFTLDQLKITQ